MRKKMLYGLLFVLILSLNVSLMFFNNTQQESISTSSSNEFITSTGISVVNSGDLNISPGDTTNHTISWTLTDNTSYDYLGVFSFTEDSNGAHPAEWWWIEDHALTTTQVIEELDGHRKVVEFYDNFATGDCAIENYFENQTDGTVEFWFYGIDALSGQNYVDVAIAKKGVPTSDIAVYLHFNLDLSELQYVTNGSLYTLTSINMQEWIHIRVQFNCSSDTFLCWVNGAYQGEFGFATDVTVVDAFAVTSGTASSGGHYGYLDAIDYSWAPGYFLNRNMEIGPVDYLGAYSFTNDADGSNPAGWTMLEEPINTHIDVVGEVDSHNKVLETWDNSTIGRARVYNAFSSVTSGAIEYWLYNERGTTNNFGIMTKDSGGWDVTTLFLNTTDGGNLYRKQAAGEDYFLCNLSDNMWYHIRVTFEHTTGNYDGLSQYCYNVYVNGIKYGEFPLINPGTPRTNTAEFHLTTSTPDTFGNFHCYVDAVDYSWAPGYYTNRNMDFLPTNLVYAIFENDTQKTSWQSWIGTAAVDYNVSSALLGFGLHNISLVYNDTNGQWFHDDVAVSISETELPNIIEVTQTPSTPSYQESVNITAHITDATQIQQVLLETNLSGTSSSGDYLGQYSFTDDADGSNPAGWTILDEPANTHIDVVGQVDSHHKVLEIWDNSTVGRARIYNAFSSVTSGTIEYWLYNERGTANDLALSTKDSGGWDVTFLWLNTTEGGNLYRKQAVGEDYFICNLSDNIWHHIRVTFEHTTGNYDGLSQYFYNVYVDGVKYGAFPLINPGTPRTHTAEFHLTTSTPESYGNYHCYLDAVDYSWAPGYYPNRNMNPINASIDYPSLYSFTDDINGADPADWIIYEDHAETTTQVIEFLDGHHKVVELYDNYNLGDTAIENLFTAQTEGTVEFWFYGIDGASGLNYIDGGVFTDGSPNIMGIYFIFDLNLLEFQYYNGTSFNKITTFNQYEWIHVRFQFNCSTDTFYCWVNGLFQGEFAFANNITYVDGFCLTSGTASSGGHYGYVDAIDYSWALGYSINRNMDGDSNRTMQLQAGSLQDGIWEYVFMNYPANTTISYRVLAQDIFGNWNASDYYSFGYYDVAVPNIKSVLQDPITPNYQDTVNITVQVTDDTQIQSVTVETNYTGTLTSYSMNFISGSLQNGVWDFAFSGYPLNKIITYQIYARDVLGNTNSSTLLSFGVFDFTDPLITSEIQNPTTTAQYSPVELTIRVVENFEIVSVEVESNHTGSWANYSMTLLNGTLQDGYWNYTFTNWLLNQSIWYRIIATDVVGRTAITSYRSFGLFPIIAGDVLEKDELDFDISGNRKCDISFRIQNTGNTTWTNINFTIWLPANWSADQTTQFVNQLSPGQIVKITFKLTAPESYGEGHVVPILIDIEATIAETGQDWIDSKLIILVGFNPPGGIPWIWIIIIVGSAAAATTSYIFIRKRRIVSVVPQKKVKPKALTAIKESISADFPGKYTVLSLELIERVNNLFDLTDEERELLIEYLNQLDEDAALQFLDQLQRIDPS